MMNNYYVNARVAQLSNKLFGKDKFNRLADVATLSDALKILHDAQYGGSTITEDFEQLLQNELIELVELFRQLCLNKHAAEFFLCSYDYHNLKVLTKCKYGRLEEEGLCFNCATLPPSEAKELVFKDDYTRFSPHMARALHKIDEEFASGNRSPQLIDLTLDRAMFAQMQECAKRSALGILKDYATFMIDSSNIMLMFRCKKNGQKCAAADFITGGRLSTMLLAEAFSKELSEIPSVFYLNEYQPLVRLCIQGIEAGSLLMAQQFISRQRQEIISQSINQETVQPLLVYYASKVAEIERIRYILICIKYEMRETIKDALR